MSLPQYNHALSVNLVFRCVVKSLCLFCFTKWKIFILLDFYKFIRIDGYSR